MLVSELVKLLSGCQQDAEVKIPQYNGAEEEYEILVEVRINFGMGFVELGPLV